ncbi:class I SAM-dependent methyltransferase [Cohnella suwonensis]|uniref:Class I SAM-dependent methyltransferase n=1 Tax=Cohnella suwonensis TaxID=696072 RepID=A0ABW0LQ25_9BACL
MEKNRTETPLEPVLKRLIANSDVRGRAENGETLSAIPFHQYMTHCLYHPDFGYYRSGAARVGREGDFYTSAFVGDVMGGQLASELTRLAKAEFPGDKLVRVFDWGGGTGRLAKQMLDAWAAIPEDAGLRFQCTVVDGNPSHRESAREALAPYIVAGSADVLSDSEDDKINGRFASGPVIVVANELIDAFPVHRLTLRRGVITERGVAYREGEGFVHCLMELTDERLRKRLGESKAKPSEGQSFEMNLAAEAWFESLSDRLARADAKALIVFVDYGDETEELLAPHRMDGTLLGYMGHRALNDPFARPGEQDLTAHVDFGALRRAAERIGWKERWYGTQKRFLVESGVLAKLSEHAIADPFHPTVRRNRAIRQLLLSDGMSELFKVQILSNR